MIDNKINGRTPEEIKSALAADYGCCSECEYGKLTYDKPYGCAERALKQQAAEDALAYIQQLERERDAAVEILHDFKMCAGCNHKGCADCRWFDDMTMKNKDLRDNWQWRGVQKGVE